MNAALTEWRETTFGEIVSKGEYEIRNNLRQPLSSGERLKMQGQYPYYGAAGAIDHINDYRFEGLHLLVAEDGTVFDKRGPMLQLVSGKFWVSNHAHVIRGKDEESTRRLYYFLRNVNIGQYVTGAVQPKLSKENLLRVSFLYPAGDNEKTGAVESLMSLDDKIDLLRKQNETLEQISRTLFDEWFTNSAGKRKFLKEVAELNPSMTLRSGTKAAYFDMRTLPTEGSWPKNPVERPFTSGSKFRNGDTLLARITPCLENGKSAFVQCLPDGTTAWGSTEFIVLRPKTPLPSAYGYLLARSQSFREYAIRSMTGTSGRQRVQVDMLADYEVIMPSEKVISEFTCAVESAFAKIKNNSLQIEALAALRDALLPKLVSGEIRV